MVPRLLNEGQKERRVKMCQDILEQLETEPNFKIALKRKNFKNFKKEQVKLQQYCIGN